MINMVATQTEITTAILTRVTLNATASAVTIIEPVKGYEDNTYTFTYTTRRLFQCGCDRCVGLSLLCIRD